MLENEFDFKIEIIDVNVKSRTLGEAGQEYFDKMYGNP